ncbi:hypothetical protein HYPSUDRAFT_210457 [Hypholoma sublateritium FD-334 SS-4]|uniref:Uncharacterized protein n=1 Tax=Hypholoma sublateritium (strain FD-334 SS-4) TaxID=945553 RepID=A0A0D2MZX0_HYPSF|nr:hypothetical protein HYPSUDRAFT_210457 [Hypholoma sublateritium FD-334 SS-4]
MLPERWMLTTGYGKLPGNLYHGKTNSKELAALVSHPSFKRIAGFASNAFRSWAPKLHEYYRMHFDGLLNSNPNLKRNFNNSVWAAAAFNFGPQTCTFRHRDFANLPFGWCSFPPGSTILLPSAAIAHSNTRIADYETRCSFTQFSAGGLFRWSSHGYQKDADYFKGMSTLDKEGVALENEARRKLGLSLFTTLEQLQEMHEMDARMV